jgi:hypothetical protein
MRGENGSLGISKYKRATVLLSAFVFLFFQLTAEAESFESRSSSPSESAAERYRQKLKQIEDFAEQKSVDKSQTIQFSEIEFNSYILLNAASKYRSCLKSFELDFMEDMLGGAALVDFDCLKETSSKSLPPLLARLFTGKHRITVRGTLATDDWKGSISLLEARLDDNTLPNILVEELISVICKRQEPPFDPLQPTPLPYGIRRVTVRPGRVTVYQQLTKSDAQGKQSTNL